jgi:hypothetical protein
VRESLIPGSSPSLLEEGRKLGEKRTSISLLATSTEREERRRREEAVREFH